MSIIELNQQETEVVLASIELRKKEMSKESSPETEKRIAEFEDIAENINSPMLDLKPLQRARIIGCIHSYLIHPNKDLFSLSDYEVLCLMDQVKDRMRKVDIGLRAINKLKLKKDKKCRLFEDKIKKVNLITSPKNKVYFSETNDSHVYKIGIVNQNGKGIKIESVGMGENFKLEKAIKSWFTKSASPTEVLKKIESYEQRNELKESQIKTKEILKKIAYP